MVLYQKIYICKYEIALTGNFGCSASEVAFKSYDISDLMLTVMELHLITKLIYSVSHVILTNKCLKYIIGGGSALTTLYCTMISE